MISPLKNLYLVSANENENEYTESGIWIDRSWDKYKHAVRKGVIEEIPLNITKPFRDDVEIVKGDTVYFHHFTVQNDNYIEQDGKKLFRLERYHLFCVIKNGVPVMVDDWILCSPIYEKEDHIVKTFGSLKLYTKSTPDKLHLLATAEFISKQAEEQGLRVGDTIIHKKDADYDIPVEGKEYYRMKLVNVAAIIRDNKAVPLRDEIVVVNNSKSEEVRPSGLIIPILSPKREQIEKIIAIGPQDEEKQFSIGSEVMFHHKTGTEIDFEGVKYTVLRQEEVIGALVEA